MKTFLWVEKYRPKSIDKCVLPKNLKDTFSVQQKDTFSARDPPRVPGRWQGVSGADVDLLIVPLSASARVTAGVGGVTWRSGRLTQADC